MLNAGLMEQIVSLAKRRGFVYPGSEIYGGLANSWDYGPLGTELKKNIKDLWWELFVRRREDMVGLDGAIIMNPKVWEASGHVAGFSDPLVECKKCHERFRADALKGKCPSCGAKDFTESQQFNLMFQTHIGPVSGKGSLAYLRPETAQAIFVQFKNVVDSSRVTLPFGIAQIGKAFRNEITPGNFIFRTREFEQMEIEYFIPPPETDADWQKHFEHWQEQMRTWVEAAGIDGERMHEVEIPREKLAHYSKRTVDFEFEYPFGQDELFGLAYRTDYDLNQHEQLSGKSLKFRNPDTGEEYTPHVIEPSLGVDRMFLAILLSAYAEVGEDSERRTVLKLKPYLAPYVAAVFPLLKNKPELVKKARSVFEELNRDFAVAWDDRGNIGKRYLSQDEIGTPLCITVDFDTLDDDTVTVRDRDTAEQERVPVRELSERLTEATRLP